MEKKGRHRNKRYAFAGGGMFLGAAIGILFGLLLFDNPWYGPVLGAAIGFIIGALAEASGWGKKNHT